MCEIEKFFYPMLTSFLPPILMKRLCRRLHCRCGFPANETWVIFYINKKSNIAISIRLFTRFACEKVAENCFECLFVTLDAIYAIKLMQASVLAWCTRD